PYQIIRSASVSSRRSLRARARIFGFTRQTGLFGGSFIVFSNRSLPPSPSLPRKRGREELPSRSAPTSAPEYMREQAFLAGLPGFRTCRVCGPSRFALGEPASPQGGRRTESVARSQHKHYDGPLTRSTRRQASAPPARRSRNG